MDINDKGHEEDDFFLEMTDDAENPERELPPVSSDTEASTSVSQIPTEVTMEPLESMMSTENGEGAEDDEGVESASDEGYEDLVAELENTKAERDKYKEQFIRKAADLDNYRKRVTREKEEQQRYGNEKFAAEMLPVLDNMERALNAVPEDEATASLRDGVDMVYKQLIASLKRFGVESFESRGTPFDPQKHEAIQQVESDTVANGMIIDEYQKGYFIHDRLLRPAMVSVSKNTNG